MIIIKEINMHKTRYLSLRTPQTRMRQYECVSEFEGYTSLRMLFKEKCHKIQIKNHEQKLQGVYGGEGFWVLSFVCVEVNPLLLLTIIMMIYTKYYGNAAGQITFSYKVTVLLIVREKNRKKSITSATCGSQLRFDYSKI